MFVIILTHWATGSFYRRGLSHGVSYLWRFEGMLREFSHVTHYQFTNTVRPLHLFKHFISFRYSRIIDAGYLRLSLPLSHLWPFFSREKLIVAQWRTAEHTAVCVHADQVSSTPHISIFVLIIFSHLYLNFSYLNPLTPELNPSEQRCLPRFFLLRNVIFKGLNARRLYKSLGVGERLHK
jgi:hypothetical protein